MATGEGKPAIECSRPLFTAPAGSDPDSRSGSLDHVAKTDIHIGDESRKTHSVRLVFSHIYLSVFCLFLVHSSHLLSYVVIKYSYVPPGIQQRRNHGRPRDHSKKGA